MKKIYIFPFLLATGLIVILSSCKNVLGPTNGQSNIVFPDSNVSFYRQVLPLFQVSCAFSGCHNSADQAGNLDLTTYGSIISAPGVVIAGDSLHSLLLQRIKGIGGYMPPPPLSTLNSNQINGIKVWILEGAKPTN